MGWWHGWIEDDPHDNEPPREAPPPWLGVGIAVLVLALAALAFWLLAKAAALPTFPRAW